MKDSKDLSLNDLTFTLVMLMVLTTANRGQSLHLLDLQGMVKEDNCFTFVIDSNIKQSKRNSLLTERIVQLSH